MHSRFLISSNVGHILVGWPIVLHKENVGGTHVGGLLGMDFVYSTSLVAGLMLPVANFEGIIGCAMVCTMGHEISNGKTLNRVIFIKFIHA